MNNAFQVQAIRHATMVITVEGKKLLVDPMLMPKGSMPASKLTANNKMDIPLTDLSVPMESLFNVDAVLLTHTHFDHFDKVAEEVLPRELPILCQPCDADKLSKLGFAHVLPVESMEQWEGLTFHRVDGNHGKGVVKKLMGKSSSFVVATSMGETLFIGGDALYDDLFERNLDRFKPRAIVLYGGEARLIFGDPITMGSEDIVGTCLHAPNARVVVVHMEAVNHCGLTREQLRSDLQACGLSKRVMIPDDGETMAL